MNGLTIDGVSYAVKVSYDSAMTRSFVKVTGSNSGTAINGRAIEDLIGYKLQFTINISPEEGNMQGYYSLINKLRKTTGPLEVVVPFTDREGTHECLIVSMADRYRGDAGGMAKWDSLAVTFITTECVWRA